MAEVFTVDLFCEDGAHESAGRALITRVAREEATDLVITTKVAARGIPAVRAELRAFQAAMSRGFTHSADLLVILIDANDGSWPDRRNEVAKLIDPAIVPSWIAGCPKPYVERWYLADPGSFAATFGVGPQAPTGRSREKWKTALVESLENAGEIVTQNGAEFASEIFEAMDLANAGKLDASLDAFLSDLRAAIRRLDH